MIPTPPRSTSAARAATGEGPYTLHWRRGTRLELKRLGGRDAKRVLHVLGERILTEPSGGRPLLGAGRSRWTWRVGEHLIVYGADDESRSVIVLHVYRRCRAYRDS